MKIFFHASKAIITPTDEDFNKSLYEYIASSHEHTSDYFIKISQKDLLKEDIKLEASKLWNQQKNKIKKADVVVFGHSEQSIGIGMVIQIAMSLSKPIIYLIKNKETVPFLIQALEYNKLIVRDCNMSNYKVVLDKALQEAKKIVDKRFTLLLPPDVVEMLDTHYKRSGQTRSEYIRDLIRHDQEQLLK